MRSYYAFFVAALTVALSSNPSFAWESSRGSEATANSNTGQTIPRSDTTMDGCEGSSAGGSESNPFGSVWNAQAITGVGFYNSNKPASNYARSGYPSSNYVKSY